MIKLFGLEGYTGHRIASERMVQEQLLVLEAEAKAQQELKRRQKDAASNG